MKKTQWDCTDLLAVVAFTPEMINEEKIAVSPGLVPKKCSEFCCHQSLCLLRISKVLPLDQLPVTTRISRE